uniref:Ceramide phosphoethanolamine synthase-like n=1 Tax=Dermatophagoides pteronyssinus TaxID=6956 RepID=A0A6P6YG93_DERPT|nr:ceramide phosphoethanolamine synthase-like [Dermatophagoides pteronyssinus]
MIDHVNLYVFHPLTVIFIEYTRLPYIFPWITANHISYMGVIFALIAARLILSDSLFIRRIGVLAFFGRQFMDDLDGYIARCRLGIDAKKQVSVTNSSGYIVDGICDGIGVVIFWYAAFCYAYQRQPIGAKSSNVLHTHTTYSLLKNENECDTGIINNQRRQTIKNYLLLLLQIGISSLTWNLFLNQYHFILDPSITDGFNVRTELQEEIFKSSLMYTITWFWRLLNPHAFTNFLLIAIWFNKTNQWAILSNQYAFYLISGLSFLCVIHLKDIKFRLTDHLTLF